MLRLDALVVIMAVCICIIEPVHFLIFRVDNDPSKWHVVAIKAKAAKSIQLSHGIFGIGKFVFFSRLRLLRLEDT